MVGVLSGGLGAFLARLEVQPLVNAGKFRGWRIVKFRSGDPLWQNTELAPGDVVTRINGASVERPEQAFAVFQDLAVAPQLRVEYERAGTRRDLVYAIDDVP